MTDLTERVARAICRTASGDEGRWTLYVPEAEAAIAATKLEREIYVYSSDGVMKTEMEPVPATSKGQPCCTMCETPLDIPGRPWTRSCGGDCLACMADVGDPDCVAAMAAIVAVEGAVPADRITHRSDGPVDSEGKPFLDEVLIHNATIHIEQMSGACYWIGITRGDEEWNLWLSSRRSAAVDLWGDYTPTPPAAAEEG